MRYFSGFTFSLLSLSFSLFVNAETEIGTLAKQGNVEGLKKLVSSGVNVDSVDKDSSWSYTPLILATKSEKRDVVKYLLENNANPNLLDAADSSALKYAVQLGNYEIVKLLLEHKANPEVSTDDEGRSPLVWSILSVTGSDKTKYVNVDQEVKILNALVAAGAKCKENFGYEKTNLNERAKTADQKMYNAYKIACQK